MESLPASFHGRPFTLSEALAAGVSKRVLRGPEVVALFRGVFRAAATPETFGLRVQAARLLLPDDAALSHQTALRWCGYDGLPDDELHFSTALGCRVDRPGIVLHRRQRRLESEFINGVPVLSAVRTFVDVATDVSDRELLRIGDWLVRHGHADLLELRSFAVTEHLDGVQRARRIAPHVRERVDSPRESDVRWIILATGLPVPEPNVPIIDGAGIRVAKGDLVYVRERVIVEHDGWHHERDAAQRQRDHLRRELLESLGWRVIVITVADFGDEAQIAWRIHAALVERGRKIPTPQIWRIKPAKSSLTGDLAS